jgi:hypothetical protein
MLYLLNNHRRLSGEMVMDFCQQPEKKRGSHMGNSTCGVFGRCVRWGGGLFDIFHALCALRGIFGGV